eukprot:gene30094-56083_t
MHRRPNHLAFARRVMTALAEKNIETYEQVRSQLAVLNAYLFHLFFEVPQHVDDGLAAYLAA